MKRLLAAQQEQINELKQAVAELTPTRSKETAVLLVPAVAVAQSTPQAGVSAAAPAGSNSVADLTRRVDQIETSAKGLDGFVFSGDFRYRFDLQARSGNDVAGPLQNARSRYRVRLSVDKTLDPAFKFHLQLSTGPYAVQTTNDQDFAGFGVKAPFSVAEAWTSYSPNRHLAFRVGRMEETFADNSRFLWDDDIRFNGFEEVIRTPLAKRGVFNSLEFRAGEYILTNPNVAILTAGSPLTTAGYQAGTRVGAANLFHPGVILKGSLSENWSHQFIADVELYRNPNQIQLASTTNGFPILASNAIGLALSGPLGATGNATTASGGAIYSAPDFQITRLAYRADAKSLVTLAGRQLPAYLDFQVSRNTTAHRLRDAMMASASIGSARKLGEVRGLYQFAIKDANALISQFTDDDLGTGSGVNIAVHALRLDIGLTRFLQWQNLLFIQHEKSVSNPADLFFVPLQRGANATFRYLGQLAFTF